VSVVVTVIGVGVGVTDGVADELGGVGRAGRDTVKLSAEESMVATVPAAPPPMNMPPTRPPRWAPPQPPRAPGPVEPEAPVDPVEPDALFDPVEAATAGSIRTVGVWVPLAVPAAHAAAAHMTSAVAPASTLVRRENRGAAPVTVGAPVAHGACSPGPFSDVGGGAHWSAPSRAAGSFHAQLDTGTAGVSPTGGSSG